MWGTHTVRFDRKGRALFVESRFELAIKILFIPVYSFSYLSTARWRDDTIEFLDVDVDDNGELFYLKAWREETRPKFGRAMVKAGSRVKYFQQTTGTLTCFAHPKC